MTNEEKVEKYTALITVALQEEFLILETPCYYEGDTAAGYQIDYVVKPFLKSMLEEQ